MSFTGNQIQDVVEHWLGVWWRAATPIHSITQSPVFAAYLKDSQQAYEKALSYWQEHPEAFQLKLSEWGQEFQALFADIDVDLLENSDVVKSILDAQKSVAKNLTELISETEQLTDREASLLRFNLRQLMAFADPRNSVCANPEFLQKMFETQGHSLFSGSQQYQRDMEQSSFGLNIQRSELGENRLGENFACTPGSVIYQNDLMQIIHYQAQTSKQRETPLLIVPPCINRFYVLDLMPENSFVRWLSEQEHDVYMISWVNPDTRLAEVTFDDYIKQGCLEAVQVVTDFTGVKGVNLMGYCIGGLMASIALSSTQGGDRVESLTLLATLLDYGSPGELGVFTSPGIVEAIQQEVSVAGILKSESLSLTFSLLREEQLLWRYIRKNYYLGESLSFDAFMHWGQDGTNLAGKMALEYIENFYQNNCLLSETGYQYASETVSLMNNHAPKYVLACKSDHIAPEPSVIKSVELLNGDIRVVSAQGGHVQGVINHPSENRGSFIANTSGQISESVEGPRVNGSWWQDWNKWVDTYAGDRVKARTPVNRKYPQIEAAPGRYAES